MWSNLTATGLAGALLAFAITPSSADEQFIPYQAVQLPDAGVLGAFDISFVNPALRTLAVAASRVVDSRGRSGRSSSSTRTTTSSPRNSFQTRHSQAPVRFRREMRSPDRMG
jgi:hypothetical protein